MLLAAPELQKQGNVFLVEILLRKQMYYFGKGNFPVLIQKHFNGAETWRASLVRIDSLRKPVC